MWTKWPASVEHLAAGRRAGRYGWTWSGQGAPAHLLQLPAEDTEERHRPGPAAE